MPTIFRRGPEREPWWDLAAEAFEAAVDKDPHTAVQRINALVAGHGWQGLQSAMQMWADAAMYAAGIGPGTVVQPSWKAVETGEITDGDTSPVAARWAGRMLAARAANDPAQWAALLEAAPDNVEDCVWQFIDIAARQVREAMS